MDNGNEMQPLAGSQDEPADGQGGGEEDPVLACGIGSCCCCLLIGLFVLCYSNSPDLSCSSESGMGWNGVIPPMTKSQRPTENRWFRNDVDVFNTQLSNETVIGRWTSAKRWFSGKAYVYSMVVGDAEQVVLKAEVPTGWNWDQSHDFQLYICSDSSQRYKINEDVSAKYKFVIGSKTRNYAISSPAGVKIAESIHEKSDLFTFGGAHWAVDIKAPTGQALAKIEQQSYAETSWFDHKSYSATNYQPEFLPNEVVSFLSAVFDLIKQDQEDEDNND